MMGVIGAGAVLGGLMMPQLHRLFSRNNLIMLAGASCSLALVPLAVIPGVMTAYAALLVFGIGWIVGASNLQATVQLATAPWVRARVLALYQAVFNGGMGLGAIFWGALGEHAGLPGTIFAAGLGGGVIALLTRAVQLPAEIGDPRPSAPAISVPRALSISEEMAPLLHSARHRLLLAISYHVHPASAAAFRSAMVEVRLSRYRDGAVGWALSRDVSDPTHWVETFRTRDWHELQRGFERLNLADSREDQCLREPPTRHSQRHGSGPCRTVQRGAHCQQDSQRQQERGIKASQRRNEREDHGRSEHQHVGQDQVALAVHQVGQSSGRERKNKHRELRGGRDQADHQWTWRQVRHDPSAGGVLDPGPQGGDSIGQPQPEERSHRQPREAARPAQDRWRGRY